MPAALSDRNLGIAIVGGLEVGDDADLDATVGRGFESSGDVTGGELVAGDSER